MPLVVLLLLAQLCIMRSLVCGESDDVFVHCEYAPYTPQDIVCQILLQNAKSFSLAFVQ